MGRVKTMFVCSSCHRPSGQWSGRCSGCGEWGTVGEHPAGSALRLAGRRSLGATGPVAMLTLAPDTEERRIQTGLAGVDRVLGGGLVPGSVVLLAGAPGIGKSTLLLQLGSRLTDAGHPCLVASGEESRAQVATRARRLGLRGSDLWYVPGRELQDVLEAIEARAPEVVLVDSIQTIRDPGGGGLPGGVSQVRTCADALIATAKEQGITMLLAGHVTKAGDVAGPRTLEHAVDTVLTFEGDPRSGRRVLGGGKNRFGTEGEVAWFEMTATGLVETEAGPLGAGAGEEPGCATAIVLAGRRAFPVDVQALNVPTEGPPRRQVTGLDARRFQIVAAVVDRAWDLRLARCELYGATAGGFRVDDPGVDLAMAAALASAVLGFRVPPRTAFVGEVSLSGGLRSVAGMEQRMAAAAGAGMRHLVAVSESGPSGAATRGPEPRLVPVRHVREALRWARAEGSSPANPSPRATHDESEHD